MALSEGGGEDEEEEVYGVDVRYTSLSIPLHQT
jgi:hypothetical protein